LDISSPEEFLADSNIPFDCEFLVAQQGAEGVVMLTEVYRIAAGRPLLYHHFGYWSSEEEFRFPSADFYFRRSSLQGLTIPTATIEVRIQVECNHFRQKYVVLTVAMSSW
jgi:hypothetical protein